MTTSVSRRTFLAAGSAVIAAGLAPTVASAAVKGATPPSGTAPFTLTATVLDDGEQVSSVTIDASGQGSLQEGPISTSTFTVHARGTNPVTGAVAYDLNRTVTAARVDSSGQIILDLKYGHGVRGCATLDYIGDPGRNVMLRLEYTITHTRPLPLSGTGEPVIQSFTQGALVNPEVDAFSRHVSASGTNYRLFTPPGQAPLQNCPLIVWLHGGGEGGLTTGGQKYYDNETTLRANRGALGFRTTEAQNLFGGAYVVAPQCPDYWLANGAAYAPLISEVIEEVCANNMVDRTRIHVAGCSNGGYMTVKMIVENPNAFASATPICPVVGPFNSTSPMVPDQQLAAIRTPTWLIASSDDRVVDPNANAVRAHELIPGSILSLYPKVTWDGQRYPGHWSWIYAARNDPSYQGVKLWNWIAAQHR